jgi:CheY-like chemotaxis protein
LPKPLLPFTLRQTGLKMFKTDERRPAEGEITPKFIRIIGLEGLRVLLAEDNEINRQFVLELLGNAGMQVDVAGDGKEAVERVMGDQSKPYDVVLMDIQIPNMDGYEATRIIRANSDLQKLPIIAMTAHALTEERQKSLVAGMDEHITKPIEASNCWRRWRDSPGATLKSKPPQTRTILSYRCRKFPMKSIFGPLSDGWEEISLYTGSCSIKARNRSLISGRRLPMPSRGTTVSRPGISFIS